MNNRPELVEKVQNQAGEKGADTRIIRCAENAESPCWLAFVLVAPLLGGILAALLGQPANIVFALPIGR
ncbi:MAG: hypothetical protein ACI4JY_10910 [Oscillospiraceae bacterium]